jgi:hypothetical protein
MERTESPVWSSLRRVPALTLFAVAASLVVAASASALNAHGQLLHLVPSRVNTNTSGNWFGYNQGTLEQGSKLFNSITGDWTVPTVSYSSQAGGSTQYSSDWIGIGGGCIDAGCTAGDPTLIQTGTEQDVNSGGSTSYSAWWEVIPAPSISEWPPSLGSMTVGPGDHMHASIAEVVPFSNVWTITLTDVTRNETQSLTVPYASTHATAEWIEETPLLINSASLAPLPNSTSPVFDQATVNGQPANLKPSEEIALSPDGTTIIATASAPDPDADGFNACTWATSCSAPGSS